MAIALALVSKEELISLGQQKCLGYLNKAGI